MSAPYQRREPTFSDESEWDAPEDEHFDRSANRIDERRAPPGARPSRWAATTILVVLLFGAGIAIGYWTDDSEPISSATPDSTLVSELTPSGTGPPSAAETSEAAQQPPVQPEVPPRAPGDTAAASDDRIEAVGDWLLVCPAESAVIGCFVQQRLATPENGTALVWTVFRDPQGVMGTVWHVPAHVNTGSGIVMDLGDGQPAMVPFENCDAASCWARAIMPPDYLDQLNTAPSVSAVVVLASSGEAVRYQLSARGLVEALSRL